MSAPERDAVIEIEGRKIGADHRPFLIAEVAQAHDGSLGMAHAFIDAAKNAGADAIKFQTHIADAESTLDEPFRTNFSREDLTRYDYWKRMEFTPEQWDGLAQHARQAGLVFLSSAFSVKAVDLLDKLGMPAWKIGSGETRSSDLLEAMAATGRPLLVSTGMSRLADIDETVAKLRVRSLPFALFQCTSMYPTPLEKVGLNLLHDYRRKYGCPVGLSDHSGTIYPALAALAHYADMIEAHVTFDRAMFGPDVPASLTFGEFAEVARSRDAFHQMALHPVDKDALAGELKEMQRLFTKSLAPVRELKAGTTLALLDIALKKPASGIPPEDIEKVVGKSLARDVSPKRLLRWEDLCD